MMLIFSYCDQELKHYIVAMTIPTNVSDITIFQCIFSFLLYHLAIHTHRNASRVLHEKVMDAVSSNDARTHHLHCTLAQSSNSAGQVSPSPVNTITERSY